MTLNNKISYSKRVPYIKSISVQSEAENRLFGTDTNMVFASVIQGDSRGWTDQTYLENEKDNIFGIWKVTLLNSLYPLEFTLRIQKCEKKWKK